MKVKPHFTDDDIQQRIAATDNWYQHLTFRGHAVHSVCGLGRLQYMPASYAGKSVLDVGCREGLYSYDAEDKGATRVLMIDDKAHASLTIALELLDTRVEFRQMSVYDLHQLHEVFDIVLFMGILYHLKYPLLGLQQAADKTRSQLILESHHIGDTATPVMRFYEHDELGGDASNWWGPSLPCLYAMLRTVGFTRIDTVYAFGDRVFINAWKHDDLDH